MAQPLRVSLAGRVLGLVVLAVGLAYLEASAVAYLRQAIAPIREVHFPDAVGEPVPLLSLEQLKRAGPRAESLLRFEVLREVLALVVLAAAAYGFRRRRGQLVGFFLLGFGVWDIFYYVFLKLMLNWPGSLETWDVLYLIPVPWLAPVWAPLVISATLLIVGLFVLGRRRAGPVHAGRAIGAAVLIVAGVGLILASFFLSARQATVAVPARFDWPLFLAGELLGVAGVVWLLARPSRARR